MPLSVGLATTAAAASTAAAGREGVVGVTSIAFLIGVVVVATVAAVEVLMILDSEATRICGASGVMVVGEPLPSFTVASMTEVASALLPVVWLGEAGRW